METAFQPPPCSKQSEPAFHRSFNYTWPYLQAAGEPLLHLSPELILNKSRSSPCVPARPVIWLWAAETGPWLWAPQPCTQQALPRADFNSPCTQQLHMTTFIYKPRQKHEKNKYITKKITLNPFLFAYSVYASLALVLRLHTKLRSVPWVAHKRTDRKVLPLIRCCRNIHV